MPPIDAALARAEQALWPLDELRGLGFRVLAGSSPAGRRLAASRSARAALLLTAHATAAFVLAVVAPSFLIAVTPLVFGVPHLAADVRYLLIRPAWPRWWLLASAGFGLALIGIRIAAEARPSAAPSLAVEHAIAAAWVVLGAVAALIGARARRGWLVLVAALGLASLAVAAPRPFRMVLLHGHNLVAVVLWLVLFRRGRRLIVAPIAAIVLGAGLLASGCALGWTLQHGWLSVAGLHLFAATDWLAPGLPDRVAVALTTTFAFLQAVHYAVWLVAVPAGDRPGDSGRSWRVAWRALIHDFRPGGVTAVVLLTIAVAAAGLVAAAPARRLFLSIGSFHAWLELAVLAAALGRAPAVRR
ncbi:MAG TPA: hypothetical protein VN962_02035 [Polyangia bacterium]|nr:hypothetical protein [Polyangia bacterium]